MEAQPSAASPAPCYSSCVRIAHFSDLHLLDLTDAVPGRLFNKRFTGYVNLRLKRGHRHKPEPVKLGARALKALKIDHVVITGDVSNLALENEFDRVKDLLEHDLGLGSDSVSIVPGNHDLYTQGSSRKRRFLSWFSSYTSSDLPQGDEAFPFVRLRGPVAIIGLSTAVPRPPLMASGVLGKGQLARLRKLLAHPEVQKRTPVVLQHHPPYNPKGMIKTVLEGLWDAKAEMEAFAETPNALVLHGHWHKRLRHVIPTRAGRIDVVGATSASLLHEDPLKMAGFNVYEMDPASGALSTATTHHYEPATKTFAASALV